MPIRSGTRLLARPLRRANLRLVAAADGGAASEAIVYRQAGKVEEAPAAAPRGRSDRVQSELPQDRRTIAADRDLMAAIADGDQGAFARLVGAETPRLLRFARSILSASPAEAEEVVQEALIRLWQYAADWQPNGRVSTWLHQVVYRLCIDNIRRRRPSVEIGTLEGELEDEAPRADHGLVRADDVRMVQAAIERLPERQRTALILCHFQDLGQAEAAAVMGIGERAYESLLARARRHLRVWLAPDKDEGESQ
jgi:RNA polymerase sigma-70 factor (ECF subfamily)